MITSERSRLIQQFQRAASDAGRYENLERLKFVRHLVEKLSQNQRTITRPYTGLGNAAPHAHFAVRRAARQGREMVSTLSFLLEELPSRLGRNDLLAILTRCGCTLSAAISRRLLTTQSTANLRLSAIRVRADERVQDYPLSSTMLDASECARHDLILPASGPINLLEIAVAVDNPGARSAYFAGIEVRAQAQTSPQGQLRPISISAFGVLPTIQSNSRVWIAFRGIDLLSEIRADLPPGQNIYGLRLLISRK